MMTEKKPIEEMEVEEMEAKASAVQEENKASAPKGQPAPLTPEQLRENMKKMAKGKMTLESPLRSKSKDVPVLEYDFSLLNGWEYAEAMDNDTEARNVFRVSSKQAFNLFAAAVAKCQQGIDAIDVKKQLSLVDAVKAVQLATLFLVTCSQVANSNSLNV